MSAAATENYMKTPVNFHAVQKMLRLDVSLLCFAVVATCIVSAEGFSIGDFNDQRCDQKKICTLIYEPVCGSDGKTYGNECVLSRCPGVKVFHEGECKTKIQQVDDDGCDQTKICHLLDEPVCGSDGKTYGNDCELSRCPGVKVVHEGECRGEREEDSDGDCDQTKICHLLDAPVCGSDGKTYGNDCELSRCPGVTLVHEGECQAEDQKVDDNGCDQTIICHLLDAPVCGSDGKTYGNDCELSRCPGVTLVHEGECKRL